MVNLGRCGFVVCNDRRLDSFHVSQTVQLCGSATSVLRVEMVLWHLTGEAVGLAARPVMPIGRGTFSVAWRLRW